MYGEARPEVTLPLDLAKVVPRLPDEGLSFQTPIRGRLVIYVVSEVDTSATVVGAVVVDSDYHGYGRPVSIKLGS